MVRLNGLVLWSLGVEEGGMGDEEGGMGDKEDTESCSIAWCLGIYLLFGLGISAWRFGWGFDILKDCLSQLTRCSAHNFARIWIFS